MNICGNQRMTIKTNNDGSDDHDRNYRDDRDDHDDNDVTNGSDVDNKDADDGKNDGDRIENARDAAGGPIDCERDSGSGFIGDALMPSRPKLFDGDVKEIGEQLNAAAAAPRLVVMLAVRLDIGQVHYIVFHIVFHEL